MMIVKTFVVALILLACVVSVQSQALSEQAIKDKAAQILNGIHKDTKDLAVKYDPDIMTDDDPANSVPSWTATTPTIEMIFLDDGQLFMFDRLDLVDNNLQGPVHDSGLFDSERRAKAVALEWASMAGIDIAGLIVKNTKVFRSVSESPTKRNGRITITFNGSAYGYEFHDAVKQLHVSVDIKSGEVQSATINIRPYSVDPPVINLSASQAADKAYAFFVNKAKSGDADAEAAMSAINWEEAVSTSKLFYTLGMPGLRESDKKMTAKDPLRLCYRLMSHGWQTFVDAQTGQIFGSAFIPSLGATEAPKPDVPKDPNRGDPPMVILIGVVTVTLIVGAVLLRGKLGISKG